MSSVIITGASSGIGRSTAIKLAESGKYEYIAINSGHDEAALIETAGLMRQAAGRTQEKTCEADGDAKTIDGTDSGLKVITVFGDISMNVTAKAIATKVMKEAGSIDVLINCAAVSYVGLLMDMTPTEWQKTVAVNLDSV